MTVIMVFGLLSVLASTLVLLACILSSRISNWEESLDGGRFPANDPATIGVTKWQSKPEAPSIGIDSAIIGA